MLAQAAAAAWGVPASECSATNSVITHKPSGRTTTYGKVAEAAAKLTPPADVPLKDPKAWKLIGKSVKRLDPMGKLTGMQVYGADLKLAGMLNAAIKDCPVFGGKVKSFEAAKVTGMPGVRHVVPVGDSAVAVVADTWWRPRPRSTLCPSCGTKVRTPRSPAPRSPRCSKPASTPSRLSLATRTATRRPPSPAR